MDALKLESFETVEILEIHEMFAILEFLRIMKCLKILRFLRFLATSAGGIYTEKYVNLIPTISWKIAFSTQRRWEKYLHKKNLRVDTQNWKNEYQIKKFFSIDTFE